MRSRRRALPAARVSWASGSALVALGDGLGSRLRQLRSDARELLRESLLPRFRQLRQTGSSRWDRTAARSAQPRVRRPRLGGCSAPERTGTGVLGRRGSVGRFPVGTPHSLESRPPEVIASHRRLSTGHACKTDHPLPDQVLPWRKNVVKNRCHIQTLRPKPLELWEDDGLRPKL
jgi:hypothetical protein